MEDRDVRCRIRPVRGAQRQHRLPLERGRPLEPEFERLGHGCRRRSAADLRAVLGALGSGALSPVRPQGRRHARRRCTGHAAADPLRDRHRHDGLRPSGGAPRRPPQGNGCAHSGLSVRLRRPAGVHAGLAGGHHRCPGRGCDPCRPGICGECGKNPRQVHDLSRRRHQPLVPQRHDLPRDPEPDHPLRLPGGQRRRLGALRRPGKGPAAVGLVPGGLWPRLAPPAPAAERDLPLVLCHRPVALRHHGPHVARLAPGPNPGAAAPRRLQCDRRPPRLAALLPAVRPQPDRPGARGRGGRRRLGCGDHRPRGAAAEEGRGAVRRRRPRPSGQLPAGAFPLARESARRQLQGPRVFPEASPGDRQRRAQHRKPPAAAGGRLARARTRGQARPAGHPRDPHVHERHVRRCGAARGRLVRDARHQHHGHAPVHPPLQPGHRPALGGAHQLGPVQDHRRRSSPSSPPCT